MMRDTQATYGTLQIIQLALAAGVLLFALIVFLVLQPSGPDPDLSTLRWVWLGFAALSIFGAGVVRGRLRRDATGRQAYVTAIIVWALAEAQALLGLVTYVVAGDALPAVLGLVVGFYLFARYRASGYRPWFKGLRESRGL